MLQEDATLQNWYKSIREHLKAARRKSSDRPRKPLDLRERRQKAMAHG